MSAFGPLTTAGWLHEHVGDPDVRVIDFRWYLGRRKGAEEYAKGHIPGAAFVELDDVTGKGPGRHPLPTRDQFQTAMRGAGVDDATAVVVYDDVGGSVAARLWFLLRWFGHERQAVQCGARSHRFRYRSNSASCCWASSRLPDFKRSRPRR